jgi:competence protein ComEC
MMIILSSFHIRSLSSAMSEMQSLTLQQQTPALKPLAKLFQVTGTAHLIAPSGFKVTILAGLIAGSTGWIDKRRVKQLKPLLPAQKREGYWRHWLATALVTLSIIAYTFLSGGGPAALRAGIMGITLKVAPRFGRVYNIYTAMALAVIIMSIFDPFVLWNTGFQLSAIGTLGIVVITPLFQRVFHPIDRLPYAHFITEAASVTLAAQIATLPIFAATFNQVSFIAPLANLLTVPLLNTLILIGTVLCVAGAIALPLGMLCGWIIWPLLKYTILIVSWCASIPDAFLIVSNNWDTRLAWCYYGALTLALGFALRRWPEKRQPHNGKLALSLLSPNTRTSQVVIESKPHEVKTAPSLLPPRIVPALRYAAAAMMILATGAAIAAAPPNEHLSIILLNVGPAGMPAQGEAILIHTDDGKTILIDGGLDATSLSQELDSRLRCRGCGHLYPRSRFCFIE